jgi:antitoxin component of RelBE/YafQ-DinJ toxin-antitoxin module
MSTPISVRLDDDALRALSQLESAGLSRSDAVRLALIEAAQRRQRDDAVRAEVLALDADEDDRREMLAVTSLMESLRASG